MIGPGELAVDLLTRGEVSLKLLPFSTDLSLAMVEALSTSHFGLFFLLSFLCGSIPFTWLIARARGVDLLVAGSGNPGATNLSRTVGRSYGIFGLVLDVVKGIFPVLLFQYYSSNPMQPFLIGAAAVVGHCYSPFLKGKGGKGVATTGGVLLALEPGIALTMLAVWALIRVLLRSVGMASVGAAISGVAISTGLILWPSLLEPVMRSAATSDNSRQILGGVLLALSCLVVVRHRSNIEEHLQNRREKSHK